MRGRELHGHACVGGELQFLIMMSYRLLAYFHIAPGDSQCGRKQMGIYKYEFSTSFFSMALGSTAVGNPCNSVAVCSWLQSTVEATSAVLCVGGNWGEKKKQ